MPGVKIEYHKGLGGDFAENRFKHYTTGMLTLFACGENKRCPFMSMFVGIAM